MISCETFSEGVIHTGASFNVRAGEDPSCSFMHIFPSDDSRV
jgi:hypothetical protein